MAGGGRRAVPPETLVGLRRRLDTLPGRHPDRARMIEQAASLYGVSATTLYRQLRTLHRPRPVRRADRGQPRKVPLAELERWCEIIAALKLRTTNKKGRHLSTARALALMEEHGVETPDGLVRLPPKVLTRQTADRYLRQWGFDQVRLARGPLCQRSCRPDRIGKPGGAGRLQWLDMDNPSRIEWWRVCCRQRVRHPTSSRVRSASARRRWSDGGRRLLPRPLVSLPAQLANAGRQRHGWRR